MNKHGIFRPAGGDISHQTQDHLMYGSIGRFAVFAYVVVFVVQTPTAYLVSTSMKRQPCCRTPYLDYPQCEPMPDNQERGGKQTVPRRALDCQKCAQNRYQSPWAGAALTPRGTRTDSTRSWISCGGAAVARETMKVTRKFRIAPTVPMP